MAITRGQFGKALLPGVRKWYGDGYVSMPEFTSKLFTKEQSDKAFEEDVGISGFGLQSVLGEGEQVSYDTMRQGFTTRYNHVKYGLGFIITSEMIEDDQYMVVAKKRAQALGVSVIQTREIVGHNVLNRAFNSSYVGGDGKELCATDHPNVSGGTWQNELTTAADISEAALEQATIDIRRWTDDRGLRISADVKDIVISPEQEYDLQRILNSPLRSGSADNDLNALRSMGKFSNVVVSPYLTDTDAWFILTNVPNGLTHFERMADKFGEDNDFDTDNLKYKVISRYSFGWTDPKGIYGSPGA